MACSIVPVSSLLQKRSVETLTDQALQIKRCEKMLSHDIMSEFVAQFKYHG